MKKIIITSVLSISFLFVATIMAESENITATIQTNKGDIKLQLFPDSAPKTVENFIGLSKKGKYNGTIFHRVIRNFMIQGGDFENMNGTGGSSIWGTDFEDEIDVNLSHKRGVISMANRGPNTNGSQFFITHQPATHLDGNHTIFGEVIEGMDVVDTIATVETNQMDRPILPILVKAIKIEDDSPTPIFNFSDNDQIPQWAHEAVQSFLSQSIIKGNDDGSFTPQRLLNRAEIAKIIVLATGSKINIAGGPHFSDVPAEAWFYPYVETMYNKNWISGYPDGSFQPSKNINRAELAKIIVNAFELHKASISANELKDVFYADWFFNFVKIVQQKEIMKVDDHNLFYPAKNVTRAEAVKSIFEGQKN